MFEVKDLLWLDSQYSCLLGVSECFGDSFLCKRMRIFALLRKIFLDSGGRFERAEESELGRRYLISPLLCLDDIVRTKTIPYKNSTGSLQVTLAINPRLHLQGVHLTSLVNPNYLLHESAHCIAVEEWAPLRTDDGFGRLADAICSEAFANTIERIAIAEIATPADAAFFLMNSYANQLRIRLTLLQALANFGFAAVFCAGMACHVITNLFSEPVPAATVGAFLYEMGLSDCGCGAETIEALAREVFTLNKAFREDTSRVYFRLFGIEDEFDRAVGQLPESDLFREFQLVARVKLLLRRLTTACDKWPGPSFKWEASD